MASSPAFASAGRLEQIQISTANTNRDGTGTITSLITGVAAGTRVNKILIKATVTTTAGMIRLFFSDDSGTTKRLIREMAVIAVTPSATVPAFEAEIDISFLDIVLPSTADSLLVSTEKAETFNVFAIGYDLT